VQGVHGDVEGEEGVFERGGHATFDEVGTLSNDFRSCRCFSRRTNSSM
jgi:hypothetical protein